MLNTSEAREVAIQLHEGLKKKYGNGDIICIIAGLQLIHNMDCAVHMVKCMGDEKLQPRRN